MRLTWEGDMNVGKNIRAYRELRGHSQEELADRARINEKYYGRIERNESCPTIEMLEKICDALDIDIIEFFLYELSHKDEFYFNQQINRIIIDGLKNDIDIHFNRDAIIEGYEDSIWYNGYIGSMNFDEFEFKLYAVGKIKGELYIDYEKVLDLNEEFVTPKLKKYVKSDVHLKELVEDMEFDEEILKDKAGDVFFLYDRNWLSAQLVNNNTAEIIQSGIILDDANIFDFFKNKDAMMDYIFGLYEE